MQILASSPIAHRVIGEVNVAPADQEMDRVLVTRLFFRTLDRNMRERFSVWDFLGYDGEISMDDRKAFEDHADHFSTRAEAVKAFNADSFNVDEWEKCECGQEH